MRVPACQAKCAASAGMSRRRSRSGGSRMGNTLMRYQRSSRKVPGGTISSRKRWVAATMRTLTLMGCCPPTRSRVPSCSTRKQAHLGRQRQLADLVEKERAAVGALEPARARGHGAGEAAPLVPEQLGVDQAGRDGATVHPQHGAAAAPRALVDGAGDDLLARAGLAQQAARARPCPPPAPRGS